MSNEKKIHEMLDRGLSDTDQQQLFSDLSTSPRLRDEFNMQLDIHNITKEDMYSIAPPKNITGAIFTGLGFSGVASIPWWSRLSSNYIGLGLSAFFASVLTFWFTTNSDTLIVDGNINSDSKRLSEQVLMPQTFSTLQPKNQKQELSNNTPNNMNSLPLQKTTITSNNSNLSKSNFIKSSEGNIFDTSLISVGAELVEMLKSGLGSIGLAREENTDVLAQSSMAEGTRKNNFYSKQESITKNKSNNSIEMTSQSDVLASNSSPYSSLPTYFSSSNVDNGKWVLTIRNISSPSKFADLASSSSALVNTIFGAQYRVFSWWSVGIEGGYEYFPQEYSVEVAGNIVQNWQQNPDIIWGGFATNFEHSSFGLRNILFPYAQFSGGFSAMGTITKGQIGLKLKPLSSIALYAAYEYSSLWYGVRGTNYVSEKDAYSLGFAFSF